MAISNEYTRLRSAQKSLNKTLLHFSQTKGDEALLAAAKEIGYSVKDKRIVISDESEKDRLFDFYLYEPSVSGKSWVQRFLESEPDISEDERTVLEALIIAQTSLYEMISVRRSDGLLVLQDLLREGRIVEITDIGMSRTITHRALLFARIIKTGKVAFCSGSGMSFPSGDKDYLLTQCRQLDTLRNAAIRSRKRFAFFIKCETTSSLKIRYENHDD